MSVSYWGIRYVLFTADRCGTLSSESPLGMGVTLHTYSSNATHTRLRHEHTYARTHVAQRRTRHAAHTAHTIGSATYYLYFDHACLDEGNASLKPHTSKFCGLMSPCTMFCRCRKLNPCTICRFSTSSRGAAETKNGSALRGMRYGTARGRARRVDVERVLRQLRKLVDE